MFDIELDEQSKFNSINYLSRVFESSYKYSVNEFKFAQGTSTNDLPLLTGLVLS